VYNYSQVDADRFEFIVIAGEGELPPGERLFVEIDDQTLVVFNIAGTYFAIEDVCSHDDGPLGDGELAGHEVICPRHGARFDVRTGKSLTLPAIVDIPAYPVRVTGGEVQIGLPFPD
jgi:3-phenylpropionate/trans-cinnamate dioxygenase ferredoxin subunit